MCNNELECIQSNGNNIILGGDLKLFNLNKKNISKIIIFIICVMTLTGCSTKVGLPRNANKVLKRNGVKNYTVQDNSDNDFLDILMRDDFTSFDVIDENKDVYFITYDDKVNNVILLGPNNKLIEGLFDDTIIPVEYFEKYRDHEKDN